MLSLREFVEIAIDNNSVENDCSNLWVEVCGVQCIVPVNGVLGREELEPFEASYALEDNPHHEVWEELYSQYVEECQEEE